MSSEKQFEYDIFISYSSKDIAIAEKLSKRIRNYLPPRGAYLGKKKIIVFRDVERLNTSSHLPDRLNEKLLSSQYLVLICSKYIPSSKWVNDEVKYFYEKRGLDSILFVLHDGVFEDCLPPFLAEMNISPLYINLSKQSGKKFGSESLRLISAIYKVDFMVLLREDEKRSRRQKGVIVISSLLVGFLLFSVYLILSVSETYWNRIQQPEEYWPNRVAPTLPVHNIAINKSNPSNILFLLENSKWPGDDASLYSIIPNESTILTDSASLFSFLKNKRDVTPFANIDFNVLNENSDVIGKGRMKLWSFLNQQVKPCYIRLITYQTVDEENHGQSVSLPLSFVNENESPVDIGRLIETLVSKNMIQAGVEYKATANFRNLVNGDESALTYDFISDDLFNDGYFSKESVYGEKSFILCSNDTLKKVIGYELDSVKYSPLLWKKIVESNDWLTYKEPIFSGGTNFVSESSDDKEKLAHEVYASLTDTVSFKGLQAALVADTNIIWDEDFLHFTMQTVKSDIGKIDFLKIVGEQQNRPDVNTETFTEWLMKFSINGNWKRVELPSDDIKGVWSLDNSGKSALLLTNDKGFFITNDLGKTWELANYNETSFIDGKFIKPFVLKDKVYALIDRGSSNNDPPNPLYRLQNRNWWERWRTGLIEILK